MDKQLKEIEIPFGANNSECCGWEYTIPEGMEATIVDNKIVVKKKESDDERIRKEIINYFECQIKDEPTRKNIINKWINWLKKHDEQKYINLNSVNIQKLVNAYKNTDEYDEDGNLKGKPVNCMIRAYEQGIIDILKITKQKDVKSNWNEEDEAGLSDALWAVEQARTIAKDENDMGNIWYAENWLKSLRYRYAWKPSDEQLEALEYSLSDYNTIIFEKRHDTLTSLYQDLKKLKEE